MVNQESLSPRQEMMAGLVAIVHTFSSHLSGLCRNEKTLEDGLTGDVW